MLSTVRFIFISANSLVNYNSVCCPTRQRQTTENCLVVVLAD